MMFFYPFIFAMYEFDAFKRGVDAHPYLSALSLRCGSPTIISPGLRSRSLFKGFLSCTVSLMIFPGFLK